MGLAMIAASSPSFLSRSPRSMTMYGLTVPA
jgi:hypothetical protein